MRRLLCCAVLLGASCIAQADVVPVFGIYAQTLTTAAGSAIYTTSSGLSTSLTPSGSLNPSSLATGLTTASLTLSGGTGGATAFAGADLGTGSLHANEQSAIGGNAISGVEFFDTLTFHGSGTVTLDASVDGTITGISGNGQYALTSILEIGPGYGASVCNAGFDFQGNDSVAGDATFNDAGSIGSCHASNFTSHQFTNESDTGYNFTGTMNVTDGESIVIYSELDVYTYFGAEANFGDTSALSLSLPVGLTFTSASGFFPGPPVSGVPEPSSVLLIATSLIGIGLFGRKSWRVG